MNYKYFNQNEVTKKYVWKKSILFYGLCISDLRLDTWSYNLYGFKVFNFNLINLAKGIILVGKKNLFIFQIESFHFSKDGYYNKLRRFLILAGTQYSQKYTIRWFISGIGDKIYYFYCSLTPWIYIKEQILPLIFSFRSSI